MNKQVATKVNNIMSKLGFPEANLLTADKEKAVVVVMSKFPLLRKRLSRQYGHAVHNVPLSGGGRRATWHVKDGALVAKSVGKDKIRVIFQAGVSV